MAVEPSCRRRKVGNNLSIILLLFLLHKAACTLVANCSLSGCSHGGTCIHPPDSNIFNCACPLGWTGALCTNPNGMGLSSDPTTHCSSAPCKNGAACQDFIHTYVCICAVMWTGKNCEQTRVEVQSGMGCSFTETKCANGACISSRLWCDGGRDCLDGSDEKDCSPSSSLFAGCKPWQFNCGDGANCIPVENRCDKVKDCNNNADEVGCNWNGGGYDVNPLSKGCGRLEFPCDDGRCIIAHGRCDGHPDCRDSSDEKNCPSIKPNPPCSIWEFDCGDGSCISRRGRCDQYPDCHNEADETNCETTQPKILLPSEEQAPPGTPIHPHSNSLNLVDILIVSCAMLMAFVAITIFVYLRRVRRMHQRYFAAVEPPTPSGTRHRHYRRQQGTPYRLSHHSTFCHHLPPHRCPASSNLLVSYNLRTGAEVVGRGATAADKDDTDCGDEVPPAYSDVVGACSGTWTRDGSETPPPAYEDLPTAFRN